MKKEKIDFRYSGLDGASDDVRDYIGKEEHLEASRDCLSHSIIETDGKKLSRILLNLDTSGVETSFGAPTWQDFINYFFGYLVFNEKDNKNYEILLFIKRDAPEEIFGINDIIMLDLNVSEDGIKRDQGTWGNVISVEPLLIFLEGTVSVWGYLQTKKGIKDVAIFTQQ